MPVQKVPGQRALLGGTVQWHEKGEKCGTVLLPGQLLERLAERLVLHLAAC